MENLSKMQKTSDIKKIGINFSIKINPNDKILIMRILNISNEILNILRIAYLMKWLS